MTQGGNTDAKQIKKLLLQRAAKRRKCPYCSKTDRIAVPYCNEQGTCVPQIPKKAGLPHGNPAFTLWGVPQSPLKILCQE